MLLKVNSNCYVTLPKVFPFPFQAPIISNHPVSYSEQFGEVTPLPPSSRFDSSPRQAWAAIAVPAACPCPSFRRWDTCPSLPSFGHATKALMGTSPFSFVGIARVSNHAPNQINLSTQIPTEARIRRPPPLPTQFGAKELHFLRLHFGSAGN